MWGGGELPIKPMHTMTDYRRASRGQKELEKLNHEKETEDTLRERREHQTRGRGRASIRREEEGERETEREMEESEYVC